MHDMLIVGGGVVGLSLAWDLAQHGLSVHLIDSGVPGREASWAGAGIIPAAVELAADHPYEQLRGRACRLQPLWAEMLHTRTGIDNGYRRCGALHIARKAGEAASLVAWAATERDQGVEIQKLSAAEANRLEPSLDTSSSLAIFHVPGEAQLRNPRHLQALLAACRQAGVTLTPNTAVTDLSTQSGRVAAVQTASGSLSARQFCFTAGAWTGQLLGRAGIQTGILPIRGQMLLFRCPEPPIRRIVNEGSRYLVPRDDGYVLVGSTEEEAGFDKRTTPEALADLEAFARATVPALATAPLEKSWAGLRPCSFDGLPYMGRLPGLENAFLSAGHFRSGLYLSAATTVVMSQLIRGEKPEIDLAPFRVGR